MFEFFYSVLLPQINLRRRILCVIAILNASSEAHQNIAYVLKKHSEKVYTAINRMVHPWTLLPLISWGRKPYRASGVRIA